MIRENVAGDIPQIDSTSFVDPSAILIGMVVVGANCYIGPGVVIRADRFSADDNSAGIVVGKYCSIQDTAVLHVHVENSLTIGDGTIINHGAVIHGPSVIGANCFIGCRSVIHHVNMGDSVFVRINAVLEDVEIASGSYIEINSVINSTDDAKKLRHVTEVEKAFMDRAIGENREYPIRYKYSLDS